MGNRRQITQRLKNTKKLSTKKTKYKHKGIGCNRGGNGATSRQITQRLKNTKRSNTKKTKQKDKDNSGGNTRQIIQRLKDNKKNQAQKRQNIKTKVLDVKEERGNRRGGTSQRCADKMPTEQNANRT